MSAMKFVQFAMKFEKLHNSNINTKGVAFSYSTELNLINNFASDLLSDKTDLFRMRVVCNTGRFAHIRSAVPENYLPRSSFLI